MYRSALRIATGLLVLCLVVAGCASGRANQPIRVSDYDETIRVICIGALDTDHSLRPGELAYLAQLDQMLGGDWEVVDWGVGGSTVVDWEGRWPTWMVGWVVAFLT